MGNVLTALAVVLLATNVLLYDLRLAKLDKRVKELEIFIEAVKKCLAEHEEEDQDGEQE